MKEIKFKIWNLEKKQWENVLRWAIAPEDGSVIDANEPGVFTVAPFSYEIVQYTGLKDKNGKEIYEGDIVKINSLENTPVGAIEWDNDMAQYMIKDNKKYIFGGESVCSLTAKYFEVLGNIYENPELLDRVEEVEEIPIMKGTQKALDKIVI